MDIKADRINKMQEGRPNIVDAVMNGKIQLIINTPATQEEKVFDDSYVRKTAIRAKVPYMTTCSRTCNRRGYRSSLKIW